MWFVCTALFILISVRVLAIGMEEGEFPVRSARGYRVWATERHLSPTSMIFRASSAEET